MTVSGVAAAIGLSNAAANGWKNGKIPSDTNLAKLAAYFGVSVSDLIEKEQKEKPTPRTESELSDSKKRLIKKILSGSDEQADFINELIDRMK